MAKSSLGKLYKSGEMIVQQGEAGNSMFVIQEGQVEVLRREGGDDVLLAILKQGDFFGEMAIFEREVRSATVRAHGEARVLTVDKKTLLRRIAEDPSLAFNVLHSMSNRIRRLSNELAQLKSE